MKTVRFSFRNKGILAQRLIFRLLSSSYDCIIDDNDPDIIVYSIYPDNKTYKCCNAKTLCIIMENSFPKFDVYDYVISPHNIIFGNRHLCLPPYTFNQEYDILLQNNIEKQQNPYSRNFCSAVISNANHADRLRTILFKKIHEYKFVMSAGKALNTARFKLPKRIFCENLDCKYGNFSKIRFLRKFKFNLSFENTQMDDYITEKIIEAFAANTVPIYFGTKNITNHFNGKSFINFNDFKDIDEFIDYIKYIDSNEEAYNNILNNKILNDNFINYHNKLKDFMICIIEDTNKYNHNNIYLY